MNKDQQQAEEYFAELWTKESAAFKNGNVQAAKMKDGTSEPANFCLSTVARVTKQLNGLDMARDIREKLKDLIQASSNQFIYPDQALHISLQGCTPRSDSAEDFTKQQVEKIQVIVQETIASVESIKVSLKGVGVIGNQIFIQAIQQDSKWETLRKNLSKNLQVKFENPPTYPSLFPMHLNFIRITNDSKNSIKQLYEIIGELRGADFGTLNISCIEYVLTDFFLSDGRFKSLTKFSL